MLMALASTVGSTTAQITNDINSIESMVKKIFAEEGGLGSFLDANKRPTKDSVYNKLAPQLIFQTAYPVVSLKQMALQGLLNMVDKLLLDIYKNKAPAATPTSQHAVHNMDWLADFLFQATGIDWPPNIILKRIKANVDKDSDDYSRYDLVRKIAEANPELNADEIIAIFREKYPDLSHVSLGKPKIYQMILDIKEKRRLKIFDDIEAILQTKRHLVPGLNPDPLTRTKAKKDIMRPGRNGPLGSLSRQNAIIETALELKGMGYKIEYPTLRNLLNADLQIAPNHLAGPKWHRAYEEWTGKDPEQTPI